MEIKVPHLGENIESATVVKVAVSQGDAVKKGQTLIEIEAEKASLEVPSPVDGTVSEILVKENDEIKVGQVIMKFASPEDQSASPKEEQKTKEKKSSAEKTKEAKQQKSPKDKPAEKKQHIEKKEKEKGTEEKPQKDSETEEKVKPQEKEEAPSSVNGDVAAAPSTRRLARELGIDIRKVSGTASGGRITEEDIKAYVKERRTGQAGETAETPGLPDFGKWGEVERKPMNSIRRKTVGHLSASWRLIPHVVQYDKADITAIEHLMHEHSTKDHKLTITAFMVKIAASALKVFPQFNASGDVAKNEIIYKKYFHIGVAVDTPAGLLVPVIRDVDKKNIVTLADEIRDLAQRAREKKLKIEEMQGGCFTVTNLGGIGGTAFAPIINWPQVAILGVARSRTEPVYRDNRFVPRSMLTLSVSYDHRFIDGADGARFLQWVVRALEEPVLVELEG